MLKGYLRYTARFGLIVLLLAGIIWLSKNTAYWLPAAPTPFLHRSPISHLATPLFLAVITVPPQISTTDGMKLMYVPAGEFQMGLTGDQYWNAVISAGKHCSQSDCEKFFSGAKPAHTVYLDAFWIDQTDITNSMYARCAGCKPPSSLFSKTRTSYYKNSQYADYPVVYVTWSQADTYCKWAGRRLPTEAQWEKAARGTDGRTFPWGEGIDENVANYADNEKDTTRVDNYQRGASPYGALDMTGNVWQWVADWYDSSYYANSPYKNPTGPASGTTRVIRGSSYEILDILAATTVRLAGDKGSSPLDSIGFRCAMSVAP